MELTAQYQDNKLLNDMLTQFKLDVLDEMTKRVRR